MIFQLTVFSLLMLLLTLAVRFLLPGAGSSSRRGRAAAERGERLGAVLREAGAIYLFYAPFALLLYLQGKPDLLPQYLGWIVIGVEAARGGAHFLGRAPLARIGGAINLVILIYLWVQELPLFHSPPA